MQNNVDNENQKANGLYESAHGRQQVQRIPSYVRGIGMHPSRHTGQAGDMHGQKGDVKTREHQPERRLAKMPRRHATGKVRQPIVGGGHHRKHHAADQHVVQMRHDEVGVVCLPIERYQCDHHTG